jgi:hypothetical protein
MHVHTLTAIDEWFIQEGQIDPLSRTRFAIGHNVVVCPKRHVLLADFYDGVCLQCGSRITVEFSRDNVLRGIMRSYAGACPKCHNQVSMLFQQPVGKLTWEGVCPSCRRSMEADDQFFLLQQIYHKQRDRSKQVNSTLRWVLAMLVVSVIGLTYTGKISHTIEIEHCNDSVGQRMEMLKAKLRGSVISDAPIRTCVKLATGFMISTTVNKRILSANQEIYSKTSQLVLELQSLGALVNNSREFILLLAAGLSAMGCNSSDQLNVMFSRNGDLFELFGQSSRDLWKGFSVWIEEVWNRSR